MGGGRYEDDEAEIYKQVELLVSLVLIAICHSELGCDLTSVREDSLREHLKTHPLENQ